MTKVASSKERVNTWLNWELKSHQETGESVSYDFYDTQ